MPSERLDKRGTRGKGGASSQAPAARSGVAGTGNTAARLYGQDIGAARQVRGPGANPERLGDAAGPISLDISGPASAQTEDVALGPGELLTVEVTADEDVELVVLSQHQGVVARQIGRASSATYMAVADERVRIQTRPAAGGLPLGPAPSARVMVSVEPAGSAESSLQGDGTAYLNARQHLLLNVFGVNPGSLHPTTGLELARVLDALEVVARRIGASPELVPEGSQGYSLVVEHSEAGGLEQATYQLASSDAVLTLATMFDASSGELRCVLEFEHAGGARIKGALTHTVALADGAPVVPAADVVGDYVRSDPGAPGELDDFSDVVAGAEPGGREGIGSFFEGAVAGDLSGNDSWSAMGGQVAMGFVPIAGQIADVRDIAAAGSDVFAGKEGSWARLGIAVIAVVPGLDFLKGGSKAGRKALRETSEGAVDGVTRAGVKRLGEVLSKEAAARAARELKALAVARREMLARMQSLLMDEGLSEAARNTVRKARNAIQDHLQPSDLSGALRDKHGLPVRKSGSGEAWDHLGEVRGTISSLEKARGNLRLLLERVEPGSAAYGKISREIAAVSEMVRRLDGFLEIQ